MPSRPKNPHKFVGLPSKEQVLDFVKSSETTVGKREIAKHFRLKGQEKIALKALLKDMAEEGLIDGKKSAFHRMGGVPKVTVLRVVEIDEGEPVAIPESWQPDDATPPPRLRVIEKKKQSALRVGDRILARTEEAGRGWLAHPMKKLPSQEGAMLGVIEIDRSGKGWLAPVDKKIRNASPVSDLGGAEEGQLVLAEPAGRSPRSGVKVIEVLGDPLAPRSYSLIAIHKFGIPHTFSDLVLKEASSAARLTLSEEKREDLRHIPILAIDPADARDHDDAIYAAPDGKGGFNALVAIADVSYYVRPGGALDREARRRGNSVYFPDRVVPMLPEVLSADACSLRQDEPRAAMVCHMHISADGLVSDWRFSRAIVKIAENIAYEDAQARIDTGKADDNLKNLFACWKVLESARSDRDPLELELPERRVMLDEQGRIAEIAVRDRLDAHRVVEDFMIAANVAAAKALEAKASPVVYRIHEPPTREKLIALKEYFDSIGKNLALGQVVTPGLFNRMMKDIVDEGEKALVMEAVLRSQTQAYYGPKNAGHFGLALGSYAHFTSPIRRYADLLVHRALVEAYGLEQPKPDAKLDLPPKTGLSEQDRDDLTKITDAISITERRAMEAERDTIDRYVAAWLSGRVGEVFDCRITGVQKFGFFATIVKLGGDGLVPVSSLGREYFRHDEGAQALIGEDSGQRYTVGDTLKLKLAEANPLTGALKFEPVDADGQPIEPRGSRPQRKPRGPRKDRQGKHMVGKRGRPGNIRHQGRGKRK
ncbi:ribonuclease R family protein [Alteraurantiacibacter aquimixticola]|uniref:Ribonuclease R n=1 Tax=Alteraurantiacibacter aquimixticola TaxID=2489173 RepID=A0A4T3F5G2_9SPHN|nr:VacB/RNase II family 3'-5' exoribonuclease [Alteraurantiacibacter aquimixticola]TIX50066.1 VacB/RNase II family 3'-5' exoribonuclease [Alteraurantiacibacter aquimixticola]